MDCGKVIKGFRQSIRFRSNIKTKESLVVGPGLVHFEPELISHVLETPN